MSQQKLLNKPLQSISRSLAADVTTAFVPVVPTTNEGEVKVADSQNASIEGVLCVTGNAGDEAEIVIAGIVPMLAGAAIGRNVELITSANGTVIPCPLTSGTTYNVIGKSFSSCTLANEFVSVQVLPKKLRLKT